MARILGLDIAETVVRGTLVTSTLRQSQVTRYLQTPIEPSESPQGRADALRAAVGELIDELGQPPDTTVACLDGREASLRVVELPAGAAKRVAEVLPFELEAMLPFPIEDAIVDHQPVGRDATTLRVLATAVPRARVAEHLAELQDAGIDPRQLAVGAAGLDGLASILPVFEEPGPHLIVELDETSTDVCVMEGPRCQLARTLSGGLEDVRSGRRAALETQLRHTLATHRASGGTSPTQTLLAGEAAAFPQAVEWLRNVVQTDTRVVPLPPAPGADDALRPRFARSAALAGRIVGRGKHIDLRKEEFAVKRTMGAMRRHAALIAVCAGVVFASFIFSVAARWSVLGDEQDVLSAQLSTVTKELFTTPTTDPARAREILEGEAGPADPLPRFDGYDALEGVSERIPDQITHDTRRLQIDYDDEEREGRIELQGTVASVSERDRIASSLAEHPCFTELEKGRTTPGPGNQGLNYQLELTIRCAGAGAEGGEQEEGDSGSR